MPTLARMKELADELNLEYKSSYTKKQMIALLGEKRVKELDYAEDEKDIPLRKGFIYNGGLYDTIFKYENEKIKLYVLMHGDKILVVKGSSSGKGLGKAGGKRKWTHTLI